LAGSPGTASRMASGSTFAGEHAAHLAEEAILIGGDRFGHGEIAVEVRPGNTASRDGRTLDEHFAPVCTIENGEIVAIETTSSMWAV
jgi:ketosteroid isomerase-like protein